MMTIDEMKRYKAKKNFSFSYIAKGSGVPMGTIQKIFGGITKTPRYETLLELERFFSREMQEDSFNRKSDNRLSYPKQYQDTLMVRETSAYGINQKEVGEYTISDCERIEEGKRVELIDGVLYDMGSPSMAHQIVTGLVHFQIQEYIKKKNGDCIAAMSPLDVQLDENENTLVQPDLLIVCDRNKFSFKRMHGAPDYVMEVLSTSSRSRDCFLKLTKYMAAGVKEYWIVDPDEQQIVVYMQNETKTYLPQTYSFADKVPVSIYGGELKIDFAAIWDKIKFLYELT